MDLRPGETSCVVTSPHPDAELRLLVELPARHEVFVRNLSDVVLFRVVEPYPAISRPAKFWSDVFVPTGVPWTRMRQSSLLHVLLICAIVAGTNLWRTEVLRTSSVHLRDKIYYYDVSEYLPPVDTGSPPAPKPRVGKPLLAKQKIISLQPNADNHEQTIISPIEVKLPANIPLPNIVAWTATPGIPSSVVNRTTASLTLPKELVNVIAPAPDPLQRDISQRHVTDNATRILEPAPSAPDLPTRKIDVANNVIEPPPDAKLNPRAINAPAPAVIEPPPTMNVARNLGEMNIGHLTATVAGPKLEVAEQRAINLAPNAARPASSSGASGGASGGGAPPIAPVGGINAGPNTGQLIALNLHPAIPNGPLTVPPGRRAGEFAAGPEGTVGAPGTPDIKAGGNGPGGNGTSSAGAGKGSSNLPAGISIGDAPGAPPPGSIVVSGSPSRSPQLSDADKQVLMAAARPPRIGEISREMRPNAGVPDTPKIEDRVFGTKKYYSMALNMPNLASAGGSWIIRFAQLKDDHIEGLVSAPVATMKVDPAYPAELLRDGVEGTVILYAVIHRDGTVGEVRILRSVQGRLDESAKTALSRWKFRPGTKNGEAVDLEAVVQIPFKAGRIRF